MTESLITEATLLMVLLGGAILAALIVCARAYGQGRRLKRWNDRYRSDVAHGGVPLHGPRTWSVPRSI